MSYQQEIAERYFLACHVYCSKFVKLGYWHRRANVNGTKLLPIQESQWFQVPTTAIRICSTFVQPAATVRNLGAFIDVDVSMKAHIGATLRSCFAALWLVRSVRRCLPHQALLTLIRALVVSKVNYCCSVLAGVSSHLLDRLQSVLNAAAWLIFSA